MNADELGRILREMYDKPSHVSKTTSIHMFGITYCDEIEGAGLSGAEILRASGLQPSYLTELHKGMRLSRFVEPKVRR